MTRLSFAATAAAVIVLAAAPLEAQSTTGSTERPAVRTAAIVVTAERVDERENLLRMERGNRFLANELRKYDRRVAKLENHLAELKRTAAEREREIGSLSTQAAAARAARLELEARLARMEGANTPAVPSAPAQTNAGGRSDR